VRVVVTGSSGQLGGALVRLLSADGMVVGLDRRAGPDMAVMGDLGDDRPRAVVSGADGIVHAAGLLRSTSCAPVSTAHFASSVLRPNSRKPSSIARTSATNGSSTRSTSGAVHSTGRHSLGGRPKWAMAVVATSAGSTWVLSRRR
jgi:dTDP-4-dehydrorhamnose reductase